MHMLMLIYTINCLMWIPFSADISATVRRLR